MNFFCSSLNIVCPTSYNLAEFLVSQLNVTGEPESQAKIQWICSKYIDSEVGKEHERKLEKLKHQKKHNNILVVSNGVPHYGKVSILLKMAHKLCMNSYLKN